MASWTRTKRDTKLRHTPIPEYYTHTLPVCQEGIVVSYENTCCNHHKIHIFYSDTVGKVVQIPICRAVSMFHRALGSPLGESCPNGTERGKCTIFLCKLPFLPSPSLRDTSPKGRGKRGGVTERVSLSPWMVFPGRQRRPPHPSPEM